MGRSSFSAPIGSRADICDGNACFICGAAPGSKKFNNEHVIPRWDLKRYDLFAKEITLPNGSLQRYGPLCPSREMGDV
jgi:hypothetical protein